MQLASLVADKNATDNTGWLPWFLIDKGYSVFPRWARDGHPNICSNVWQNHSTNTFAASMCNGIGLGNDMWVKLVHSSEMSGLNTNWFCSCVKIQKTRWSNFPFHRFTVLLTWGSCCDSNCSSTCTVPMGLHPPRMALSLKSWRSFISRISCRGLIASTLWLIHCIRKPLRVWCVCVAVTSQKWSPSTRFCQKQGFSSEKARKRLTALLDWTWFPIIFWSFLGLGSWGALPYIRSICLHMTYSNYVKKFSWTTSNIRTCARPRNE